MGPNAPSIERLQVHPLADLFPPMGDDEFAALKADIAAHGQRVPILTLDGRIVDGRNRHRACLELGRPPIAALDGPDDPVAAAVSLNLLRRHLGDTQRAAVAAKLKPVFEARARERQATSTGGPILSFGQICPKLNPGGPAMRPPGC